MDWKRNQDIVLTVEGYKYILTKERLDLLAANSPRLERERYEQWVKDDEMAHCYILGSMSPILQHQLKDYSSAMDMILSLKEMFGEQGQVALRTLMNTKMAEGTLVRDHILKYLII